LFFSDEILLHFEVADLIEDHGIIITELVEKGDAAHIPKEIVPERKTARDGYMNSIDIYIYFQLK